MNHGRELVECELSDVALHFASALRSGARKLARVRVFCVPLEYVDNSGIRTLKGCRGLLAPFQGAAVFGFRQPGVALAPARLTPG